MKEISKNEIEALVRDRLAELGSPFPFTINRRKKDYRGCNWRVTCGPVTRAQHLTDHVAACTKAWSELGMDYNLAPQDEESKT